MTELEDLNIPTQAKSRLEWATRRSVLSSNSVLRRRRSNFHLQHFPLVHSHRSSFTEGISSKAAPSPKFRGRRQSALYRIATHVAQFLDACAFRPHVEIIVRVTESL